MILILIYKGDNHLPAPFLPLVNANENHLSPTPFAFCAGRVICREDAAMYRAKRASKGRVVGHDS